MDAATLGWLAGILDGEGHFGPTTSSDRGVIVRVEMIDEDVIRRLHAATGEGRVNGPLSSPRENCQDTWRWTVADVVGASRILLACYPMLSLRRQERIGQLVSRLAFTGLKVQPCGTNAAYMRHRKYGEVPCAACFDANRSEQRERRRRKLAA
jgi:hypothetical protein